MSEENYDKSRILAAVNEANLALSHEQKNELKEAILSYQKSVDILNSQLGIVPEDKRQLISVYLEMYKSKVSNLKKELSEDKENTEQNNAACFEDEFLVITDQNEDLLEMQL